MHPSIRGNLNERLLRHDQVLKTTRNDLKISLCNAVLQFPLSFFYKSNEVEWENDEEEK